MDADQFIKIVEHEAVIGTDAAERATRATLQTLAERISPGQARDLIPQLPGLGQWLYTETPAEGFGLDEFLRRVAEREGTDPVTAEKHTRAVFAALGKAVTEDELSDLIAELPQDFAPLIAEAQSRFDHVPPAEEFLRRVAAGAGLDLDGARHATEAVLETLAERIAGGEVDDLISALPVDLHPPLKRGRTRTQGRPEKMNRMEFVERIAEREGVRPDQAFEDARAVFAVLREVLDTKEFTDVTAQLPGDFSPLIAPG